MDNKDLTLIIDISQQYIGKEVTITGIVLDNFAKSKESLGVKIKDFTGTIIALVNLSEELKKEKFWKNTRLQLTGVVFENHRGEKILTNISNVKTYGTKNATLSLSDLNEEMNEKASQMMMSRICRNVTGTFYKYAFVEFESRVISKTWVMDGLEPLHVIYPGFGGYASLITSPSSQIIEFIDVAMVQRAFTVSTSFTTTYRFINGATETRVIMGKVLDMTEKQLCDFLWEITKNIINEYESKIVLPSNYIQIDGNWPNFDNTKINETINLVNFNVEIISSNDYFNTRIEKIIHIIDKDNNILAEGSREELPDKSIVSTMTVYPSQFLSLLKKSPARQLQNLWRRYDRRKNK